MERAGEVFVNLNFFYEFLNFIRIYRPSRPNLSTARGPGGGARGRRPTIFTRAAEVRTYLSGISQTAPSSYSTRKMTITSSSFFETLATLTVEVWGAPERPASSKLSPGRILTLVL